MSSPFVTIGITAFNADDTILRAVLSALAQDWPHFEVLVYDDASVDDTPRLLKEIEAQNPNVRVVYGTENKGVAYARNRLIEMALGEFLAFFDDDDVSVPDRVLRQYERILAYERDFAHGAPVICHSARTQYYPDGVERYEATMGMDDSGLAPHGEAVALRVLTGKGGKAFFGSLATCSQMGRVSLYRGLGGFDEGFRRGEDTDFSVRLALAGGHFAGVAAPLVRQTMTMGAEKNLDEELALHLKLMQKHRDFITVHASYGFCRDWLVNKYRFLAGQRGAFLCNMAILLCRHPVETLRRLFRALPNTGFNLRFRRFHDGRQ
ncbi:MAG: glycosyltransferase family 2 protein [Alphaproteobacteria bacterium]|nr:glycosyltransferase family 2 protein [Alphaproteobacteria bacterium]